MLKWLGGGKPDHPMADIKEARELLSELPANDPYKSLEEISGWIESVTRTEGFRLDHRIEVIKLLDESAQQHQRKLGRDYLTAPRLQKFQENRMWTALFNFWKQLGDAYVKCLEQYQAGAKGADAAKSGLPLMICRGLRALSAQLKWLQVRYLPIDENIWGSLGNLDGFAESRGISRQVVTLYPGVPGDTSVEQEFLKILMLWVSSPNGLNPLHIDLAERITAHFSAAFVAEKGSGGQGTHCFDLTSCNPPMRLAKSVEFKPTLRFFGPGTALAQLQNLMQQVEKGVVPRDINLGAAYKPSIVHDVLRHLALHWGPKPPARKHTRHRVTARLDVIGGFERLLEHLGDEATLNFEGTESWIVDDISAGGFGAAIPETRLDWVRVGSLLGIRPEGVAKWGVGVVRRLSRNKGKQGHVGVQTLATEAVEVKVRPLDSTRVSAADAGTGGYQTAVLLSSNAGKAGQATLLMKAGSFSTGWSFEMLLHGKTHLLIPIGLLEKGEDFDLGHFREMERQEGAEE